MINGILIIQKERDFTSHDVVAKLRGICKQKKIGHTGTLDPNATGVLPVCLGNATKMCDLLTDHDKEYIATLELGKKTDTQDIWGQVLETSDAWKDLKEEQIKETIQGFVGEQMQTPPMYSALKVNGKKLYELARAGITVEREKRKVIFYEIEILDCKLPSITIRVSCSRGTYIRTLCEDIGEALGCFATMTDLERTKVGVFEKEMAHTLSQLEKIRDESGLEQVVIPVEACFQNFPKAYVKAEAMKYLKNGNELKSSMLIQQKENEAPKSGLTFSFAIENGIRICDANGVFYGVYKWENKDTLKPWKMFFPEG